MEELRIWLYGVLAAAALAMFIAGYRMKAKMNTPEAKAEQREGVRVARDKAARGEGDAQLQLALAYHIGMGLPRDPVEAYFWMTLALNNTTISKDGYGLIKENMMKEAERNVTAAQRADVGQRVADWRPGPGSVDTVLIPEGA